MNEREEGYLKKISAEAVSEVVIARDKFSVFNSPHEGAAVIAEEWEELWDLIKADNGRGQAARREAIQVAAMALRYVFDLCEVEV